MREAQLGVAVGKRGIGKSYTTTRIMSNYVKGFGGKVKPRRVLIMDVNDEFQGVKAISPSDLSNFACYRRFVLSIRCPTFVTSASFGAVNHLGPVSLPFLSPREWSPANGANFCWQILFSHAPLIATQLDGRCIHPSVIANPNCEAVGARVMPRAACSTVIAATKESKLSSVFAYSSGISKTGKLVLNAESMRRRTSTDFLYPLS